jgi:hypothetical protein
VRLHRRVGLEGRHGGEHALVLDGVVHGQEAADLPAQAGRLLCCQRRTQSVHARAYGVDLARAVAELPDSGRELGQLLPEVVMPSASWAFRPTHLGPYGPVATVAAGRS